MAATLLTFGDTTTALLEAIPLLLWGIASGAFVYRLVAGSPSESEDLRTSGPPDHSKRIGLGFAVAVAAAGAVVTYLMCLSGFFGADLGTHELTLRYRFPTSTVRLTRGEIARIGYYLDDNFGYVVVHASDGKIYESATAHRTYLREKDKVFQAWLRQSVP